MCELVLGIVRYVFLNEQQAATALEHLRRGFTDEHINMRRIMPPQRHAQEFSEDHDPVGGWRLAGTPVMTLPAAGATLVGNSTTVDVSIGDLDELLAVVADDEPAARRRRVRTRILADVEVHSDEEAQRAREIMGSSGGYALDSHG